MEILSVMIIPHATKNAYHLLLLLRILMIKLLLVATVLVLLVDFEYK